MPTPVPLPQAEQDLRAAIERWTRRLSALDAAMFLGWLAEEATSRRIAIEEGLANGKEEDWK